MTSGNFHPVAIASITIPRNERQRRELPDIDSLARSIATVGLINPITITPQNVLIAGERRLTACKSLGWTHISAQYTEDITTNQAKIIELEENARRSDLTWQESCNAIHELHYSHVHDSPDTENPWSIDDTAATLNMAPRTVHTSLQIARALADPEHPVHSALSLSQARPIIARVEQRKRNAIIAEAQEITAHATDTASAVDTTATTSPIPNPTERSLHSIKPPSAAELFLGSFMDTFREPWDHWYSVVHCDFPYGINFNSSARMATLKDTHEYDDSFTTYQLLLEQGLPLIPTTPDAHLIFWFSPIHYEYTKLTLVRQGWMVNPFPLIWAKSDNMGIIPDAKRGGRRTYEMAFVAAKGDPFIVKPKAMHWHGPRGTNLAHPSTKPRDMLEHFLSMFVDSHTTFIDPTAGSANAVWVAEALGARLAHGWEVDPVFHERALLGRE